MENTLFGATEEQLIFEGGYPLSGEVQASGAKNAVLPLMAAALLTGDTVRISGSPLLHDTHTMARLIRGLGGSAELTDDGVCTLACPDIVERGAEYKLVKRMRASILVLGPLLSRFGEARVALPGGDAIGPRPIDLHLRGFEALGATISVHNGEVVARAARLKGARIVLDITSVGATENLLMAAALAEGETVIVNAAQEPEIEAMCILLQRMGVQIDGVGSGKLHIQGCTQLSGASIEVIPDRIEVGTWLYAVAAAGGDVVINGGRADHLDVPIASLRQSGVTIEEVDAGIRVASNSRLRSGEVRTNPYPGFPTDLQSQAMAAYAIADGQSRITETVFENRYQHAAELARLGARIRIDGTVATIEGVGELEGAPVEATDIRAGAGLVIGGLAARGQTQLSGLIHLDRGYEKLEEKLLGLGAHVRRIEIPMEDV